MNIFYIFLPILTLINISVQDAIITPSGAIALAKIQQQKSKAIAHVLKTRAERNIAKAKLQYSLPQKSLWRRSTDNAENTERENPQIPCESGDMRCANPFQRKAIQDPQFVDKNNQQLESQGALENMWAMNQMQNKDGGDILRRDDNAKNADPTHHGVHTHFYQKTHGITKNIGGYSSGIHPQVNPVNVHVIQNQESIGYNNGHGFGQSHQISNANANANANAQAFSNANNFGQYGTQFGQSNAHSSANAQAFSNSNAHQIVPVISNYGGHQGVHSSASAHASASAHSNSGGYAQTIPVNIVGRTEEDIAPTESTPVNDGKPKQVAYVPTGKKVSIIPILNIPASYNISEEPLQWIIIDQDRKEPQVLDGVNINSLKNETKHSSEENHSSEEKKDIDLKNFDEDSHIFNIIEKILLKNDSKKSYDVKNAEIRRIMFGKERVEVEMLPTLYNPIKEPNVRSNDTAEHLSHCSIKIEDPVNQTSHSSARRNDPFDDKKEDIKNTTVNPLFDNSAVQPLIHEGEKNDDNFDLVTPPPDLIEETDEKLETSPPKISQVTTRKIFNQTSGKKHLFDYPTTTGVDDLINVATTTENVEQTTVYSKEHVEMASRHHSDSGDTKKAPELDEFTKEVIRNASKKVYVPPVVPLNSTDLIPKGPLKKIEVYPPGKRVEINPLRVIPKGFNGTLEPDQFYIDRRNDSNQGEIFFVSSTTESNVDSNMQAAKSLSKQRSYYHEEQPNYNNNNNDNQYQQYQQSYDSYPNNNQQYGYQPPQQYESQRGLGLSSQLRQYFKPFSQSDLRDVYFSRPDHDYYQNNYQQDQGPYYARNSRHNPQHSFKENIGSFDRGELSQKSSDYYDHEMLGAPMDNKDRLKSLPVLPENFQNLEGPTQEKLIQEYLNNDEKYLKDLIENEKKSSDVVEKDSVVGQPQEKIREDDNQMVLGEGLNLPEQLMHPFMDQPTKQQLRQFLEENGDKSPEGPSQNDLGKILGASNPAMMEKNFRESEGSKFQNPEEMFHNKERTNFKVDG